MARLGLRLVVLASAGGTLYAWAAGDVGTAYGLSLSALGLALMRRSTWG
jgi:hypothetical protein